MQQNQIYQNKMKRIILLMFILASTATLAQKSFQGGLMLGLATSQMSGDGLAGWNKFGAAGGGWVRIDFTDQWSATMGMQFVNKGSRTKMDTVNFNSFAYKLNYIEVPLTIGLKMGRWRFNLGMQAGFLITQKIEANGINYSIGTDFSQPKFNRYDIGATTGATFSINGSWALEIKGSTSVLPTRLAPFVANKYSFYEKGNYNQVIQFMILKGF